MKKNSMKSGIRTGVLAMAILGAACGAAWTGDVSQAYAMPEFKYGESDGRYPVEMSDGVRLCYTHMDSGIYVDETSAYIVSQEGSEYTIAANMVNWNKFNGYQGVRTRTYVYNTSTHKMYLIKDDGNRSTAVGPIREHTSQADIRTVMMGMQIWHAVMHTEWRW